MGWKLRCTAAGFKALLPFQEQLRLAKDRVLGYQHEPAKDAHTIRDGLSMIEILDCVPGSVILEIGTGWQPMIPVLYSLAGAARVYTVDLHRLVRHETFLAALGSLRENKQEIAARLCIPEEAVDHVVRECRSFEERCAELRIHYLAPCDCTALPLDAGALDIVVSRAVLEHIPPQVIDKIFGEARRLLRADGRMCHLIDHSDHWSHQDKSISAVNFLRYSDSLFRLTCIHPQSYQNRLRHPEYIEMLTSAGFAVLEERRVCEPANLKALLRLPLAERFRRFSAEDLATTSSTILAQCA
jgi:cyclopropane fatty-acyl-phospholipid synthase-like methyltransferase